MVKKKKRILMLYDFPIKGGGSGAYVKYLSLRLQETKRYDVAIAMPDKSIVSPLLKQYYLKLPQIPVFIGRPGLEKEKKYSELTKKEIAEFYTAFLEETVKIVEDFKPDVIHVHHMMVNAWVAQMIRSIYGVKYVVTSHGSCMQAIGLDRRYHRSSRDALRAADRVTVVSGDTREKLLDMFGHDLTKKTRTIAGGIVTDLFPEKMSANSLTALRKELGVSEKGKVALFTGRLINEKGIDYIVKAASKIQGEVVIAGDGPQRQRLEKMVKTLKLTNVHMKGHFDYETLVKLYYIADVFISPAVWDEPLGLTIIEAMAAGKPVVVTRKGGVTMAVKDGITGLFVRPRNATDIAEKVNKLFKDPVLAKKMGERARVVVLEKFTWRKIAHKFDLLYSSL